MVKFSICFDLSLAYGIALFAVERTIRAERERKIYHYLNTFGLTPWIALHLFYIMILTLFSWMNTNGYSDKPEWMSATIGSSEETKRQNNHNPGHQHYAQMAGINFVYYPTSALT